MSHQASAGQLRRLLAGLGALIVLVAVTVGVPLLLISLHLLPTGVPSVHDVTHTLTSRDDGHLAAGMIAAGVWLCWALFTATAIAEVAGALRQRPSRMLPGLGWCQRPAAALVAAVALGIAVAPLVVSGPGVTPAEAAPPPLPVLTGPATIAAQRVPEAGLTSSDSRSNTVARKTVQAQERPAVAAPAKVYTVRRRDTLWAIAEKHLGDPLRYPEIARLNPGSVGPDGQIRVGAVLVMPGDATGLPRADRAAEPTSSDDTVQHVHVHPGDTLWAIEEKVTGNGANWPAAWQANQGRVEPDGQRYTDPDLIRPGWTLDIPTTSHGNVDEATAAPDAHQGRARSGTDGSPINGHRSTPLNRQRDPAPQAPTANITAPSSAATTAAPTTPTSRAEPSEPAASSTRPGPSTDQASELPIVAFAGGGVLFAGLSLGALIRYRRRQFRWRRPGRTVPTTPPELRRIEQSIRSAGAAGTTDVTWLDQALRSLVHTMAQNPDARLPDVLAASLSENQLELVLAAPKPEPPAPWTADESCTRWFLSRQDPLPYKEDDRHYYFAPYPALASVGYTAAGEHWMLDLERAGTISMSGDPERCVNLARFLAAELAHNTWSEMLQVTLVGFGAELIDINPDRLTYTDDLDQAIAMLLGHHRSVSSAMTEADVDVLTGRLRDVAGDVWAPHILLLAAHLSRDAAAVDQLLTALNALPLRTASAVMVADESPVHGARLQLTMDANGVLRIPQLDLELIAHQIPPSEAAQLAQMLALAADTQDQPMPAAHGDRPWDRYADAAGGLRPELTAANTATTAQQESRTPPITNSALPLAPQSYVEKAATTAQDVETLAPEVDAATRERVSGADPTLEADLADWYDDACPRPKVTLLGPVSVRAQGPLPTRNPRLLWNTEIIAYLATRPRGVTSERYGTDLWPDDPDIVGKTKLRQSITIARSWLGTNPATGREYLPLGFAAGQVGTYRIEDALVDAELFRRLRLRGVVRGTEGMAELRAALDLVTGVPFDPQSRRPDGYSWLNDPPLDHEYVGMIVDVAHLVATHHLGAGEPQLAAAAAQTALKAGSSDDVPLLDLIAACDAQDNRGEADAYIKRILANHGAEIEEDLPPRTAEILFRRQKFYRAS